MKQKKIPGEELFESYYSTLYGERWNNLKDALLKEKETVSLEDCFFKLNHELYNNEAQISDYASENKCKILSEPYFMDKASVFAASCLPIRENYRILDMCAAPGGKTLVLALKIANLKQPEECTLVSNDRSPDRRFRLTNVINSLLPKQLQNIIRITGHDSTKWGLYEKQIYDAILLDAPCSSERHVIQDKKALSEWSPHRPKELKIRQYAMLSAAFDAVKIGGYILYSTCSVNCDENEEVIRKLFKRKENRIEMFPIGNELSHKALSYGFLLEQKEFGYIIMPDTSMGAGPLYFCLLKKIS